MYWCGFYAARRDGQFNCSFVANLLQHLCAKNYQNTMRFDKIIARVQFFCLTSWELLPRQVKLWQYVTFGLNKTGHYVALTTARY